MKQDRRVNKTKKLIEKELIELLKTKKINEITVKELCEKVDINRGTFYHHYLDIYDVIGKIEDNLLQEFNKKINKYTAEQINKKPLLLFEDILEFINNNASTVIILFNTDKTSLFLNKIINLLKEHALQSWGKIHTNFEPRNYEYFLEYVIYGCLRIINKWLDEGRKESPKNLAILLEKIVLSGANFLKNKNTFMK